MEKKFTTVKEYIRENPDKLSLDALAYNFAVTKTAVSLIQRGKTYKHIDGARKKIPCGRKPISKELANQIRIEYQKGVAGCGTLALVKKYHISLNTLYKILRSD